MDINHLRNPSAILKMIELMLLIIIMALFFSQLHHWVLFVSSVIIGCFLNALVFLANIFMGYDQYQKTPLELILSSYYLMSLFISGILLFTLPIGAWIAGGVFCLILALFYAGEVYISYMNLVGGTPAAFPAMPQSAAPPHISQNHHSVFPAEPYPPPPTYPNSTPMQQVDLGNPFDESRLQQL